MHDECSLLAELLKEIVSRPLKRELGYLSSARRDAGGQETRHVTRPCVCLASTCPVSLIYTSLGRVRPRSSYVAGMSSQEKEVKVLHRVIRQLAHWAVVSFFHRVHIIGAENVVQDGPLIVCAGL
jgi:hypothetical protein